MRYIWTLWTDPWKGECVWDLMCYAVSIGLVRRFSNNLCVYTDQTGADLLGRYGINVATELVDFDVSPATSPRFAEAKLKTISLQTEPFCHLDHDVFLFKEQKINNSDAITVQNMETAGNFGVHYRRAFYNGLIQGVVWPDEIIDCAQAGQFYGYNCGYIQANDISPVKHWAQQAIYLSKRFDPQCGPDNVIVEQMYLYALSKASVFKVGCLFEETGLNQLFPEMAGYIHLMMSKVTDRIYVTSRLMERAKEVAPEFYSRCFSGLPLV